jgi:hypothetical protein
MTGAIYTGPITPDRLKKLIALFIISNNLAIRVVDSKSFKDLVIGLNGSGLTIPNRKTITTEIETIYKATRRNLTAKLTAYKASGGRFSLCIDAWTSKSQHAFLGITVHFMDENFKPQMYLLELADLKRRHTGKYMAQVLVKVLRSFNISDKIHCITRDNASSNSTLFASFEKYYRDYFNGVSRTRAIPCIDHILNLICQDILKQMKATISTKELQDLTEDTENVEEDKDEEQNPLTESSLTTSVLGSTPKAARLAKSINKRDSQGPPLKKAKTSSTRRVKDAPLGLNAFQKLRYIVGKLRLQQVLIIALAKELSERPFNERRKPTLDSPTRWNSTYKMINDFIFQLDPITIVISRYPKYFVNLSLSETDIDLVKSLAEILAEIEALTILFQGNSYTSIQFVLPLIFNLDLFLDEIVKDINDEVTVKDPQLKKACKEGLDKLRKYFNRSNLFINDIEPWAIAIILDPRLRFNRFRAWGFTSDTVTLLETRFRDIFNRYELEYFQRNPISTE